jgi:tetratricopeptide (TPR) repeat protein
VRFPRLFTLWCAALLACTAAGAQTIRLKNGRSIAADQVRDTGETIEYDQGENSFAIPKSVVERIEATPVAPAAAAEGRSLSAVDLIKNEAELFVAPESASLPAVSPAAIDRDALRQFVEEAAATGDRHALAAAYDAAAVQLAIAHDHDGAASYLRLAMGIEPDSATMLAHYAGLLLSQQKYAEALPYAERAARLQPDRADVQALLGYADYFSDRIEPAIAAWRKSLALKPDATVARFLAKAERDQQAQRNYAELDTGHFTLHFEGGQTTPELRKQLLELLEADFNELVSVFGISPRQSIPVVIYSTRAFAEVTQAPAWVEALNDGKLRIPLENASSLTPELARVLKHELAHSFINQITHARCPQWLNEGIAQVVEGRVTSSGALAQIYAQHRQQPLAALEGPFTNFSGPAAALAYSESLATVEYIRDQYGFSDVVRVLQRIGGGLSGEAALRATIHSSYADLDSEVAHALARRYQQ